MSYAAYIKYKLESDRKLAILVDKVSKNIKINAQEQKTLIENGFNRVINHGSCFFEDYKDACRNINKEYARMLLAIRKVYNNRDVFILMLELYIRQLLKKEGREKRDKTYLNLLNKTSKIASGTATNSAFSYVIAKAISQSTSIGSSVSFSVYKYSKSAMFLASNYGRVQIAADCANKLKISNPEYYYSLYNLDIEMLYFIIDPQIKKATSYAKTRAKDESEMAYYIIEGLLNNE